MAELLQAVKDSRAWACYDCGKCTGTCPIARVGGSYSPRRHVLAATSDVANNDNGDLFACLTCGACGERCPVQVRYSDLIRGLREHNHGKKAEPECPHGGALQSLMRMMAGGGTQQDRLAWLTDDLKTDPKKGEVFYWTGCAAYYDAFFTELELATLNAARAAIRLMNRADIVPVVSVEERCCGHDLLWNGDRENFERLARHNVRLVEESGAATLVTSCAECLRTWKIDYQPFFTGKPPKVVHITELLADVSDKLPLKRNCDRKVTFQDPCRLGRHLGIYDPPRDLLSEVPGIELVEMRHSRSGATCCAGGTWSNCDRFAKRIQVERLREAKATGAEILVTACPKCQIHLKCAMKDPNLKQDIEIELRDVVELLEESVGAADVVSSKPAGTASR